MLESYGFGITWRSTARAALVVEILATALADE
jgi:hypothetical protein